jgi:NAD(P)-dependent dehydrogenase (short-subunit alcohol dehydrogenase family)
MGLSTARRLGYNYRVLLADIDSNRAEERAATMREDGYDVQSVQCDITDPASVDRLAETVKATGPMRAIAHVAAKSPSMGTWREILTLNLIGAALVERALQPLARQGTAAVFVSSMAAHILPTIGQDDVSVLDDPLAPDFLEELDTRVEERSPATAYAISKLAVNRMCARRAVAWGRLGARIVSMSPGMIATPMGALEFSGGNREQKIKLLEQSPIGREGTMIETAYAIEFLISDRASFITGTDLLVDGGVTAAIRFPQKP